MSQRRRWSSTQQIEAILPLRNEAIGILKSFDKP
jgi:hypothetical protein